MAATSGIPPTPNAHNVSLLLTKLYDADSDFRYMALSDLRNMLNIAPSQFIAHDFSLCAKTIDGLLHTLNDTNGDVQNMAIQCLGPFVNKVPESIMCPLFDKISTMQTENVVDSSIPALALRTIVMSLPRPIPGIPRSKAIQEAYNAVSKVLIPRLVGHMIMQPSGSHSLPAPPKGMLRADIEGGTDSNAIDVVIEVAHCFGSMLAAAEVDALQNIIIEILDDERTASGMKKKAVIALSALSIHFQDSLLSAFVSRSIESLRDPHLTNGRRKISITVLGSVARAVPSKFGRYLKTLAPFVLAPLSQSELDEQVEAAAEDEEKDPEVEEVREAALVAIESFLAVCSQDMRPFTSDVIGSTARYLKYDPNVADDEDMEEEEEEEALEGDDFEEEQGYDDDEDASWKLRRCAAKVFHTLIYTRSPGDLLDDGTLYKQVAPALVARFKEREESVRLEVLSTLSLLIRNTRTGIAPQSYPVGNSVAGTMGPPPSRKRRRAGSDASMLDSTSSLSLSNGITPRSDSPLTGPQAKLSKLAPEIIRAVSILLKNSPVTTKEASISLLKNLILALRGGLAQNLAQIIDPAVDAIRTGSGGTVGISLASANSYRIQALQFAGAVAEGHTAQELQPYFGKLIPAVVLASRDKYSKVSVDGLTAIERLIEALTPPRSTTQQYPTQLEELYGAVIDRISANTADLEVRQEAIRALGLLLSRTSGAPGMFPLEKRLQGLDLILQRLQNELTRLSSVRAIDAIAATAQSKSEFRPQWVQTIALELGAQLRKASRSLRGASLNALRTIVLNASSVSSLDTKTVQEIVQLLLPIVSSSDLHLLGPALIILAELAKVDPDAVVKDQVVAELCKLLRTTVLGSSTLESLLTLVKTVGKSGKGSALMGPLLRDVGIGGNTDVVGKVVGSLLVAGGEQSGCVGVKLDDFITELNTAKDDKRKCLALSVLGEAGVQLAASSPLKPDLFIQFFHDPSEKVPLTAALALGRAGAGNIATFLPVILSSMSQSSDNQYLLLHSLKEILQHDGAESEIIPYTDGLWQNVVAASRVEDNRAVGAECIGRLAIIDPKTYLPQLKTFLSDPDCSIRAMVISALRYTFADTDESYDDFLRPMIIDMLKIMLNEQDLDNRRLALITFNSATHNKSELILPHLDEFLPLVMTETIIKPELVREVSMGPFKHKVDDGLEIRKSAYETLYVLLDTAFSRLNVPDLFDRVIAGVGDEHDIKVLCCLMLSKLVVLAPEETINRLNDLAEHFRCIIGHKPKENAVKQELEKLTEAQKGVFKVSMQINKTILESATPQDSRVSHWNSYWDWASNEHKQLRMIVEEEMKEKER